MVTHGDTQPDSVTPPPHRPPGADGPSIRGAVPSLVIDGLLPFLTYVLLTSYAPHLSQVTALGLSATFPSIYGKVIPLDASVRQMVNRDHHHRFVPVFPDASASRSVRVAFREFGSGPRGSWSRGSAPNRLR